MDINVKLDNLKIEHNSLREQYGEIYKDGSSYDERELVGEMRKIEATFRTLDLNVFRYEIV